MSKQLCTLYCFPSISRAWHAGFYHFNICRGNRSNFLNPHLSLRGMSRLKGEGSSCDYVLLPQKGRKKIIMFPHSLSPRFFSDLLKSVMPFSRWRAGWLSNSRGIFLLTGCWSCWKWFKSLLFQHHAFIIFQPPVRPIPPFLTIRCLIISRIHALIFSSSDISLTSSSLHIVIWFCILSL